MSQAVVPTSVSHPRAPESPRQMHPIPVESSWHAVRDSRFALVCGLGSARPPVAPHRVSAVAQLLPDLRNVWTGGTFKVILPLQNVARN